MLVCRSAPCRGVLSHALPSLSRPLSSQRPCPAGPKLHGGDDAKSALGSSRFRTVAGGSLLLFAPFSLWGGSSSKQEDGISDATSQSSSVFRAASPAALRSPPTTLLFLSTGGEGGGKQERTRWHEFIGYFREAGYNCIDLNVAVAGDAASDGSPTDLGKELSSQITLASLPLPPLLFAHAEGSVVLAALFEDGSPRGRNGTVSGAVLVEPHSLPEGISLPDKLRVALVGQDVRSISGAHVTHLERTSKEPWGSEGMREIERWMTDNGY